LKRTTSNAGVTVGRRPGSGGLDVAVGEGVMVGVLVRVGKGVQVLVGVHVAGKFCTGRKSAPSGVTVGRGVSVEAAVADGMICATIGYAAALDRVVKRPNTTCNPASTTMPTITQIKMNSIGLRGLLLRICYRSI